MSKAKFAIIFTVLMDTIGLGVVIPSLVFHVQDLGGSDLAVIFLFAVFSLCAFISSPFLGVLSDRVGRRPVLLISILSTSLGWAIFAGAHSLWLLFLGRIIDGLAAGNFSTAQSYLADISHDEKERITNLGLIGGMFGLGFVVGPLIGGVLSIWSPQAPFWFTAILAGLNFISVYFFLPESLIMMKNEKMETNPFKPLFRIFQDKSILPFYIVWFMFGLVGAAFQSIISLIFSNEYGFNAFTIGLIIAVQGILMAFNQMIGLKSFWLKKFKVRDILVNFLFIFAIAYLLLGFKLLAVFAIGYFLLVFLQPVWRVVLTSEVMSRAPAHRKGETMGSMASIVSLGMIVGPFVAGPLSNWYSFAPFWLSAILMFVCYIYFRFGRVEIEKIKKEAEVNVIG